MTKVRPGRGTGKENMLTKNERLGWSRVRRDEPGGFSELRERLSPEQNIVEMVEKQSSENAGSMVMGKMEDWIAE